MRKISVKLSLFVIGSVILASLLTSGFILRSTRQAFEEDLQYIGKLLTSTVSAFCVETLLEEDYPYLQTYIQSAAQETDQVARIRVFESQGDDDVVVAEYTSDPALEEAAGERHHFHGPIVVEMEDMAEQEILGSVEVLLSSGRLKRLMELKTLELLLGAVITTALLAIVIWVVLKKTVVDPVKNLNEHATRIGAGDLDGPIEASTRDELGRLATTMESMRENLKRSYHRIESQVEELQKLDRMKDEFLANTSHELKTPLNGILGLTDCLQSGAYGEISDEIREPLKMIAECGDRLWKMTESILECSRLVQQSGAESPRESLKLRKHLDSALVDLKATARHKGVLFRLDIPEGLTVSYRRSELEQLIRILADNAVKFTPEGGTVEITARKWTSRTVPGFQVAVRDTGIGIPEKVRAEIFKPFVQGFEHETRAHGGVGLGLSIAMKLTERLEGFLRLDSERRKGTTFSVAVPEAWPVEDVEALLEPWPPLKIAESSPPPAARREAAPTGGPGAPSAPAAATHSSTPGTREATGAAGARTSARRRILVVDDEPINVEVLVQNLQPRHDVVKAYGGKECLEVLRREDIDLVLLDIMMPEVSGYDVLGAMKEQGLLEQVPVVVVSAKSAPESIVKGLKLGAADYVSKPFHAEELLCRVESHLTLKAQRELLALEVEEKTKALQVAEQASFIKSQFLANMSHEIRTPINGIMGFLNLLVTDEDDDLSEEERQDFLDNMTECTETLIATVNDILDTVNIESRQVKVHPHDTQPVAILNAVFDAWKTKGESKGLAMRLEVDADVPETIWTDGERLRQALHHLVGNAVKFTDEGEVRVSAARSRKGDTGDFLEVVVRDSGIGIDRDLHEEIFKPFTQVDGSTTRKYGGTGLGLNVSRSYIRMLGGDILVESTPGDGSAFFLRIPVQMPSTPAEAEALESPAVVAQNP